MSTVAELIKPDWHAVRVHEFAGGLSALLAGVIEELPELPDRADGNSPMAGRRYWEKRYTKLLNDCGGVPDGQA